MNQLPENYNPASQGLMKWARNNGKVELMVKPPYTTFWISHTKSVLFVIDYLIPGGSKGYATMQNCLRAGYIYDQPKGELDET